MRQIDPLVDCVFKAILGVKEHDWMLIQFLNDILKLPTPVQSVKILNPYSEAEFMEDKQTIVDILATDQNGRTFQVEIQLKMHPALAERCLYTWSTAYRSQLSSGAPFSHLKPTYSIWLMRETLTSIKSNLAHLCFEAYDRTNNVLLSEHMQIHVLQLSKWSPPLVGTLDGESAWLYFLKEAKSMQELPTFLRTPALEQAMTVLRRFAENEEDYHRYQAREHWLMLQATLEEDARLAREALQAAEERAQQAEVQAQQEQAARQAAEVQAQQEQAARQAAEAQAQAAEARSKQDAARAERLAERLRALGIDDA